MGIRSKIKHLIEVTQKVEEDKIADRLRSGSSRKSLSTCALCTSKGLPSIHLCLYFHLFRNLYQTIMIWKRLCHISTQLAINGNRTKKLSSPSINRRVARWQEMSMIRYGSRKVWRTSKTLTKAWLQNKIWASLKVWKKKSNSKI